MSSAEKNDFEFTLQDTLDYLKEIKSAEQSNLETLIDEIQNLQVSTLSQNETFDENEEKREKYVASLRSVVEKDVPKDYALPNTRDVDENLIRCLDNEINFTRNAQEKIKNEIDEYNKDVTE